MIPNQTVVPFHLKKPSDYAREILRDKSLPQQSRVLPFPVVQPEADNDNQTVRLADDPVNG